MKPARVHLQSQDVALKICRLIAQGMRFQGAGRRAVHPVPEGHQLDTDRPSLDTHKVGYRSVILSMAVPQRVPEWETAGLSAYLQGAEALDFTVAGPEPEDLQEEVTGAFQEEAGDSQEELAWA